LLRVGQSLPETDEGALMKRVLPAALGVAALVVAVVAITGCGNSSGSSTTAKAAAPKHPMPMPAPGKAPATVPPTKELHRKVVRVAIKDFKFVPARVVVSPGTRVVWTNTDSDPHTVTSDSPGGTLDSSALDTGDHFATVLKHSGTNTYHCTVHPYMHGAVLVQG
jgi:plastocyanin